MTGWGGSDPNRPAIGWGGSDPDGLVVSISVVSGPAFCKSACEGIHKHLSVIIGGGRKVQRTTGEWAMGDGEVVGEHEPMSWPWVQDELRAKGRAIATSLQSGVGAAVAVPNLEWNVGRLGAHIVAVAQFNLRAQDELVELPDVTRTPVVEEFSDATAAAVGTTEPEELAAILPGAIDALLARLGPDGSAPAKWYQHDMTALEVGGVVLSELLIHHHDLVGATGEPPGVAKISTEQARAAFRGLFAASSHVVNPEVARECQGVIHLYLTGTGGGDHWTVTISGETAVTTPGNPPVADFHTMANPATLLMTSLGRASEVKAFFTGQIVGIGRNPKLGLRSRNLYYSL